MQQNNLTKTHIVSLTADLPDSLIFPGFFGEKTAKKKHQNVLLISRGAQMLPDV